jgi:hypothetical protein
MSIQHIKYFYDNKIKDLNFLYKNKTKDINYFISQIKNNVQETYNNIFVISNLIKYIKSKINFFQKEILFEDIDIMETNSFFGEFPEDCQPLENENNEVVRQNSNIEVEVDNNIEIPYIYKDPTCIWEMESEPE